MHARLADRHGGANRHFIGVRRHGIDFAPGHNPVVHQVNRLAALPFGTLLLDNFDIRVVLEHRLHPQRAVVRGVVGQQTEHDRKVALATHFLCQVAHLNFPGLDLIRADIAHTRRHVLELWAAVDVHQRDLGLLRVDGHFLRGRRVHRIDDNRVHALGREVLHLVELAHHITLGVFELQGHAG